MTPSGQTLCLSMIVKDEAHVIRRCLASVRPIIDHWIIVDTGSTDGTQNIIREAMAGLPGAVHERPWRDFAQNRSEALALARPHGTYSLVIDADDELDLPADYRMPDLSAESYTIDIRYGEVAYQRTQLVRNSRPWRYEGVLHEYLECDGPFTAEHLPILMRINHEGRRSQDPATYRRDVEVLERALATEANPFLVARYTFYLAQSYRDCGETEAALKAYLGRATLGYWDQEIYYSLYQAGRLMERLGHDPEAVLATYLRATDACPSRAEAAHAASRLCRHLGLHKRGYAIAKPAIDLVPEAGALFVEKWIHDYGLLDEFSVNAYWAGHYRESLDAALRALASGKIPEADRKRFLQNARFAAEKLGVDDGSAADPLTRDSDSSVPRSIRPLHSPLPVPAPRVLVAILVMQKEPVLPLYLRCLEALDYPKSSITLYVRTNNNTDRTREILRSWLARAAPDYAHVEVDDSDIAENVDVQERNDRLFAVAAAIRNESLRKTIEHDCDYYFVVDVENFIASSTLRDLVASNLPIVAPLLRDARSGSRYSNYHADIDVNGYFVESRRYDQILAREITGLIEVPVVHGTYLVRTDIIPELRYDDTTGRHEYVIFSHRARSKGIRQYLDNRQVYGYLTRGEDAPDLIAGQLETIAATLFCDVASSL